MKAEEILQKFDLHGSSWTFKGFHGVLHTLFPVSEEALLFDEYFGDTVKSTLVFLKNNFGHWCWRDTDMRRIRDAFIAKVNQNPRYLSKLFLDWKKRVKKFDQIIAQVNETDLSKLSDEKLLALYEKFYRLYVQEYSIAVTVQDAFSMYSNEFLEPAFAAFFKSRGEEKKFQEHYNVLMAPTVESFVNEELQDRLRILRQIQKNPSFLVIIKKSPQKALAALSRFPSIQKAVQKHALTHFFVKNNYAVQARLSPEMVLESLAELINENVNPDFELKKMKNQLLENKKNKRKRASKLKLPKGLHNLVKIADVFTVMQDVRKKYVLISNQYQRDFFEEIGRRLKIPVTEMEYTVFPELSDMLLKKKFDRKKLRSRKKHSVVIHTKNSWHVFEGTQVDRLFERLFASSQTVSEIKGLCASVGKATGRVRIVLKTHDFINMQDGDILVTSMTRPEFVPLMKKAAAIVTDEGGITSHAAIVSRELGVPCIIGTKKATQVLKDGEMVEVDATNGVVQKLSA